MKKYIYLLLNEPFYHTMNAYLHENKPPYRVQTAYFSDDLSIGPLTGTSSARVEWFMQTDKRLGYPVDETPFAYQDKFNIPYIMENCKFNLCKNVVWHGPNVVEQCALRYFVSQLAYVDVYEADITEVFPGYRSTAECSINDIQKCLPVIRPMKAARKRRLAEEWDVLNTGTDILRILEYNKIMPVAETYYDALLCKNAHPGISRELLIGTVMGLSQHLIGDYFLRYRLTQLQLKTEDM